ncbi:NAD(P)H-dependent FMN reductase [bacterium A37T11]|nr:NAD(P)H-dependent FMN reductase [bacterium A37T11]
MLKLKVISSTVRPGRKGPLIGRWVTDLANSQGNFEAELLDLGEIGLPLMNEPVHPAMQQYEHEHTKAWSAKIAEADAYIFVTAEYDYSYPAPLKNALEYLLHEWGYKPAGIISYSIGPFAGVRAAQNLKNDLLPLKVITVAEVPIPIVDSFINEEGAFVPTEQILANTTAIFGQLSRWAKGLKVIKEDA